MKVIRSILIGIGIWILAVSFYTFSYQFSIMENPDQQANMVLFTVVMPLVWLGSFLYYKSDRTTNGYRVGQTFLMVAAFLDALITVPIFVIPNGGNHYTFFTDPSFWIIAFEMVATATLYYYTIVYPKNNPIKA